MSPQRPCLPLSRDRTTFLSFLPQHLSIPALARSACVPAPSSVVSPRAPSTGSCRRQRVRAVVRVAFFFPRAGADGRTGRWPAAAASAVAGVPGSAGVGGRDPIQMRTDQSVSQRGAEVGGARQAQQQQAQQQQQQQAQQQAQQQQQQRLVAAAGTSGAALEEWGGGGGGGGAPWPVKACDTRDNSTLLAEDKRAGA